jgi:hypothetical protein
LFERVGRVLHDAKYRSIALGFDQRRNLFDQPHAA